MDGLWNSTRASEKLYQKNLTRHRILTVNTSPAGVVNELDASSYASVAPNSGAIPFPEGGPHFHLSPETPDGRPTLGFELTLGTSFPLALSANFAGAGFDVTVWVLIANTTQPQGLFLPKWASFATQTGVQFDQLFHTFDVNATAIRIQIANVAVQGSVVIQMAEL